MSFGRRCLGDAVVHHPFGLFSGECSVFLNIASILDASDLLNAFLYQSTDVAPPCSRTSIILSAISSGIPYLPVISAWLALARIFPTHCLKHGGSGLNGIIVQSHSAKTARPRQIDTKKRSFFIVSVLTFPLQKSTRAKCRRANIRKRAGQTRRIAFLRHIPNS